jgi:hypothetical protein
VRLSRLEYARLVAEETLWLEEETTRATLPSLAEARARRRRSAARAGSKETAAIGEE